MSDPAPRALTIADLYEQGVALVASAMNYPSARLKSEQTAVRIYELTLMWALNNRAETAPTILPPEVMGDEPIGEDTTAPTTEDA